MPCGTRKQSQQPLGRQESWEDSPDGWPQTEPYTWWRRNDEYEHA